MGIAYTTDSAITVSIIVNIISVVVEEFSKSPKQAQHIWASFVRQFIAGNFQKSPNLVTLTVSIIVNNI